MSESLLVFVLPNYSCVEHMLILHMQGQQEILHFCIAMPIHCTRDEEYSHGEDNINTLSSTLH